MFGSDRAHKAHPDGTTVTTTTHTTKTVAPYHPGRKVGMMDRLRPRKNNTTTMVAKPAHTNRVSRKSRRPTTTTATTAAPRKTSMGDKLSGAMTKLRDSATHRPGEKAAGTRRMYGTDGRLVEKPRYY